MTISTATISGTLVLPDDTALSTIDRIEFTLTSFETEDATILPEIISADVDENGDFSIDIWPNETGVRGTQYQVFVIVSVNSSQYFRRVSLGNISVPAATTYDLDDLLGVTEEQLPATNAAAAASALLAYRWANEAEDVEVEGGEFSAYHQAKKAEGFRDEAEQIVTDLGTLAGAVDAAGLSATTAGEHAEDADDAKVAAQAAQSLAETAANNAQASALTCATWAKLVTISGSTDGEGAEVLDSDAGMHLAASATGYDGSSVNNAGRYSWNASWSRWVRIGDTGLSKVSAETDAIVSDIYTGKNLFDSAAFTTDYVVRKSDGVEVSYAGFIATDFIRVIPGAALYSSVGSFNNGVYGTVFYDIFGNVLSSAATSIGPSSPVTVPVGAAYAKLTYASGVVVGSLKVWLGTGEPEAAVYGLTDVGSILSNAVSFATKAAPRSSLITPITGSLIEGFYTDPNGALVANSGYYATEVFSIVPGESITLSYPGIGGAQRVQWFDRTGAFHSASAALWAADDVFTAPEGAYFFRTSISLDYLTTAQILRGSVTPGPLGLSRFAVLGEASPWAGKNVAAFGDSIIANSTAFADACDAMSANYTLNAARGGRTVVNALKDASDVALVAGDLADIDVAYFQLGTNDYGGSTPLGAFGDTSSDATFYGYYTDAVLQLLAWKPTLKILTQTMMYRDGEETANGAGNTLEDYRDAVRDISAAYGFPVHEVGKESRLHRYTMTDTTTYSSDGLHPNSAGVPVYSSEIVGFFERYRP